MNPTAVMASAVLIQALALAGCGDRAGDCVESATCAQSEQNSAICASLPRGIGEHELIIRLGEPLRRIGAQLWFAPSPPAQLPLVAVLDADGRASALYCNDASDQSTWLSAPRSLEAFTATIPAPRAEESPDRWDNKAPVEIAMEEWGNPVVLVRPHGYELVNPLPIRDARHLSGDELEQRLLRLPSSAFPHGRIVIVDVQSILSGGDSELIQDNLRQLAGILESLKVELYLWPTTA